MSRLVVCDTGPLLHLHEAGYLELIRQTGDIIIPPVIAIEFARHVSGDHLPDWIRIIKLKRSSAIQVKEWINADIDAGEAQAIALAVQEHANWFLTDDGRARRFAESLGMEVHGSVGLILWIIANGYAPSRAEAHALLDRLTHSSLWISQKVLNKAHQAVDVLVAEK